jgi:hypothetical protein
MNNPEEQTKDFISHIIKAVGENLFYEYYERFLDLFNDFEVGYGYDHPTPLEIFFGIAQALADVSGYRIVLEVELLEPIEGDPETLRKVGNQEVASFDSTFFVQTP